MSRLSFFVGFGLIIQPERLRTMIRALLLFATTAFLVFNAGVIYLTDFLTAQSRYRLAAFDLPATCVRRCFD